MASSPKPPSASTLSPVAQENSTRQTFPRSPTKSNSMMEAWDDVRERACTLYTWGKTLGEVQDTISHEYGFEASTRAWQTKLKEWNVTRSYDTRDTNSDDNTHPRIDSGQWTGDHVMKSVNIFSKDNEQASKLQLLLTKTAEPTSIGPHPVRDAMLRLYNDLQGSLPTQGTESVIKSHMNLSIAPCAGLPGLMKAIADIDLQCYARLLKTLATNEILRPYAVSQLQQIAWLNEDDPTFLVKDCPASRCSSVETWCLNHNDEAGYGTGVLSVAGEFDIKALCCEILNPCPSPSKSSLKANTRSASLARLLSRWKNSGRLPEAGEMVSHLLKSSSLLNPTPLFEILCRQFPSLAKDPRALAAIAGVPDPLRYDLSAILFENDGALSEWLLLASINLGAFSKSTETVLESWHPDRRRCFDQSFVHFVVPFLGYRKPLQEDQKATAFVVIQCVVHVVTVHFLGQSNEFAEGEAQRSGELEQVLRMRRKFRLDHNVIKCNEMDVDSARESIIVERAETWLVDW